VARLLIVEEDETIGSHLESRLRLHDYEVVWRRSGRGAIREATLTSFDLVLLDLGLPDLDGVEVCGRIRAVQPGCVLVIITARDTEMDVVVGLEAGADDYVSKPFGFAALLARIRAHLRRGAPPPERPPRFAVGRRAGRADRRSLSFLNNGNQIPNATELQTRSVNDWWEERGGFAGLGGGTGMRCPQS
jgi:DNA-binding response OmpR family regulator